MEFLVLRSFVSRIVYPYLKGPYSPSQLKKLLIQTGKSLSGGEIGILPSEDWQLPIVSSQRLVLGGCSWFCLVAHK